MSRPRRAWVLVVALGCIIPDRDISVNLGDNEPNEHAVRIIERTPLSADMREICANDIPASTTSDSAPRCGRRCPAASCGLRTEDRFACVPVSRTTGRSRSSASSPRTATSTAMLPATRCTGCSSWTRTPLIRRRRTRPPSRTTGSLAKRARSFQRPTRTRAPCRPKPATRPRPGSSGSTTRRRGRSTCATAIRFPSTPAVHNLQFIVTDRPFFVAEYGEEADIPGGADQCGVPDLAAGATYAVINYIFECIDESDEDDPRSEQCDCAPSF